MKNAHLCCLTCPRSLKAVFRWSNLSEWSGILAPANTPPEIVAKIRAEYVKALQDPEVAKRISELVEI